MVTRSCTCTHYGPRNSIEFLQKLIKSREVMTSPNDYYEIFTRHGTVYYLGIDIKVYDWKRSASEVLKTTSNTYAHFNKKNRKDFFLKGPNFLPKYFK